MRKLLVAACDRLHLCATHPIGFLDFQLQFFRELRVAAARFVDAVLELLCVLREQLARFLLLQFAFDLRLHFVERFDTFRLHFGETNDVIAEIRLDRPAHFTWLHRENGFFKGLHHLAAAKEAQITALCCGARIFRFRFGERGERFCRRTNLLHQAIGLRFRCVLGGGFKLPLVVLVHAQKDVACTALFWRRKFLHALLVLCLYFFASHT